LQVRPGKTGNERKFLADQKTFQQNPRQKKSNPTQKTRLAGFDYLGVLAERPGQTSKIPPVLSFIIIRENPC
jgi:hypothetical protein